MDEDKQWLEAWRDWRLQVIEAITAVFKRLGGISNSKELRHLKMLLEDGPMLVDYRVFLNSLRDDPKAAKRLGLSDDKVRELLEEQEIGAHLDRLKAEVDQLSEVDKEEAWKRAQELIDLRRLKGN